MRIQSILLTMTLVSSAAIVPNAAAHHAFGAFFDPSTTVVISGKVTEFHFINPHAYILVNVTNDAGEQASWQLESTSVGQLFREGLTPQTLHPGDNISAIGNPARDGRNLMRLLTITMPDGEQKKLQ